MEAPKSERAGERAGECGVGKSGKHDAKGGRGEHASSPLGAGNGATGRDGLESRAVTGGSSGYRTDTRFIIYHTKISSSNDFCNMTFNGYRFCKMRTGRHRAASEGSCGSWWRDDFNDCRTADSLKVLDASACLKCLRMQEEKEFLVGSGLILMPQTQLVPRPTSLRPRRSSSRRSWSRRSASYPQSIKLDCTGWEVFSDTLHFSNFPALFLAERERERVRERERESQSH